MKFTSILALIAGLLSALLIIGMVHGLGTGGFENGAGMAILFFMVWGAIFSLTAIFFGIISWMIARKKELPMPRLGKFGFGAGVLSAIVIIAMNVFG